MGEPAVCSLACAVCGQPLLPVDAAPSPATGPGDRSRQQVTRVCMNAERLEFDVATSAS